MNWCLTTATQTVFNTIDCDEHWKFTIDTKGFLCRYLIWWNTWHMTKRNLDIPNVFCTILVHTLIHWHTNTCIYIYTNGNNYGITYIKLHWSEFYRYPIVPVFSLIVKWSSGDFYNPLLKGAHRDCVIKFFCDLPIAVITSVCICNSLSHASITLFLAHQDVINDQIWISIIPRPAEFRHGLDLNHTTLVQSQVIGFRPLITQFLATVIGQKSVLPCLCQFVIRFI